MFYQIGLAHAFPRHILLQLCHHVQLVEAGKYQSLRIILGEGEGHNWWCVVFPPLCTTAATDLHKTAIAAGLTEEEIRALQ